MGVAMGTRAMVLKALGPHGPYAMFYRHLDGYPTALGTELIGCLRNYGSLWCKGWADLVRTCGLEDERAMVERPEDAFLRYQGDLEWIYVVEGTDGQLPISLTILKTSFPWELPPFVFPVWFSYREYFPGPHDTVREMAHVQLTARMILRALEAYHKAIGRTDEVAEVKYEGGEP